MSRIEELRKARGWSRFELGTLAGVTEHTILRAERTSPPAVQARSLEKIAQALGVSLAELHAVNTEGGWGASLIPAAADPDVLFIQDLARDLRTNVRRLRNVLRKEPWKLPEPLPSIDNRMRWSRVVVDRWLELREPDRKQRARESRLVGAER